MATISENLQTIADSTAAIKQAIIDKGGEISGDITTWADAINGISGGEGSEDSDFEINNVYISLTSTYISAPGAADYTIFCTLEKPLDISMYYFLVSYAGDGVVSRYNFLSSGITEFECTVTLNPLSSTNIERDFAITLCSSPHYNNRTKYTFKYNYL